MRLFQLFLFAFLVTDAFGQQTKSNVGSTPACVLPLSCVTIVGNQPIKPFKTSGRYIGHVIIVATLDSFSMQLINHKLVFADLYLKTDTTKRIEMRLGNQSGNIKYLDTLLPNLVNHLKYVKFRLNKQKGCIMTTAWNFPITVD